MLSKKLPKINFIGNKEKIASWICSKFPKKKLTVFDAFSGGASISYEAKKNGFKDDGKHSLMLGIAYFEKKNLKNSEDSFIEALNSKKYADQGKAWLEYLEALKG